MSTKLNVTSIITEHYRTLRNQSDKKISKLDLFVFVGVPIIISLLMFEFGVKLNSEASLISTVLSIFAALLLNLLVILYTLFLNENNSEKKKSTGRWGILIREVFSNIAYCILVSIFCLVTIVISLFLQQIFETILNFISAFLVSNFILSLVMIVKRMYVLLRFEFDK
jgi:hypothetical protein